MLILQMLDKTASNNPTFLIGKMQWCWIYTIIFYVFQTDGATKV